MYDRIRHFIFGKPRDLSDPGIYHKVSLAAFLAWVGLGSDGLSSSCYGPEEAFRALGPHAHLAVMLAVMTAVTILVIAVAYSNLIEHFPGGGGGYLVATQLLGEKTGVVSGSALIIDYVLTITVSVASGCDALWSFLPPEWGAYKLTAEIAVLVLLMLLNMRGVKESVTFLAPIFLLFVGTHVFAIVYAAVSHLGGIPAVMGGAMRDLRASTSSIGVWAVALILLKAYSMGGGTYTGIEAVSNGINTLREPRVQTGKRTMALMAASLAFTAGGILLCYLLLGVAPAEGKTMNAVLFGSLFSGWEIFGVPLGHAFLITALVSEAALLFVAAQTGFLDGPRVLANMAVDSWMPRRFSQLSERLVTKDGILLMGAAAVAVLLYTKGDIGTLVVMYSINVFITFSLTELGMARHWITERASQPRWKSQLAVHGTGLLMCLCILIVTLYEKFSQGGWVTALITTLFIGLCFLVRRRYDRVNDKLHRLDILMAIPEPHNKPEPPSMDSNDPVAVITVGGYSGFGIHQVLSVQRMFPDHFRNFLFVSVGVVDSGSFKGAAGLKLLSERTERDLGRYVAWCRARGLQAGYRFSLDTEVIGALEELCLKTAEEFPKAVFFTGKLILPEDTFVDRLLHNETAFALHRRLQLAGTRIVMLPVLLA